MAIGAMGPRSTLYYASSLRANLPPLPNLFIQNNCGVPSNGIFPQRDPLCHEISIVR